MSDGTRHRWVWPLARLVVVVGAIAAGVLYLADRTAGVLEDHHAAQVEREVALIRSLEARFTALEVQLVEKEVGERVVTVPDRGGAEALRRLEEQVAAVGNGLDALSEAEARRARDVLSAVDELGTLTGRRFALMGAELGALGAGVEALLEREPSVRVVEKKVADMPLFVTTNLLSALGAGVFGYALGRDESPGVVTVCVPPEACEVFRRDFTVGVRVPVGWP